MPQMQIVAQLEHSLHKERERLQVKSFSFFFFHFQLKKSLFEGQSILSAF